MNDPLILRGLDAANPLAFLAALGVLAHTSRSCGSARIGWCQENSGWRPGLSDGPSDAEGLAATLFAAISESIPNAYVIDKRLPFPLPAFRAALESAEIAAEPGKRRELDLLASLGTDACADDKGYFADTRFRMVRSGDSAGQGLCAYAAEILAQTTKGDIARALFSAWDYSDDGFSLRWDPIEDQRYALRWYDPSPQTNKKFSVRTMRGANALALEGLALMPVIPTNNGPKSTGFTELERRRDYFTWPIWEVPIPLDTVRSLVALRGIHQLKPDRSELRHQGIVEVYRCERIAPNKYYKNFIPAIPT